MIVPAASTAQRPKPWRAQWEGEALGRGAGLLDRVWDGVVEEADRGRLGVDRCEHRVVASSCPALQDEGLGGQVRRLMGRALKHEEPPRGRLKRYSKDRRRPTLPGPFRPSTIGATGLDCSVRNGKRYFPRAIATGNLSRPASSGLSKLHNPPTNGYHEIKNIRQALDPLVPVSCACYHAS